MAIREKAFGSRHPRMADLLMNYAALLRTMGREEEAATLEARAKAISVDRVFAMSSIPWRIERKDILSVYIDGVLQFYY